MCLAVLLAAVAANATVWEPVAVADPDSLVPPVRVAAADIYRDGGTIGVRLVDSVGRMLLFCINQRLQWNRPEPAERDTTIGRLFVGARYPTKKVAALVPAGGREECSILELLKAYLDRHYSPVERDALRLRAETWGMYDPPALDPPLKNGVRAMTVMHAIRLLEGRCEPPN